MPEQIDRVRDRVAVQTGAHSLLSHSVSKGKQTLSRSEGCCGCCQYKKCLNCTSQTHLQKLSPCRADVNAGMAESATAAHG